MFAKVLIPEDMFNIKKTLKYIPYAIGIAIMAFFSLFSGGWASSKNLIATEDLIMSSPFEATTAHADIPVGTPPSGGDSGGDAGSSDSGGGDAGGGGTGGDCDTGSGCGP